MIEEHDSSPHRSSRHASTSLFLGVVALISSPVLVGGLIGLVAIALGTRALKHIESRPTKLRGKAMAATGILLGTLALLAAITALALYLHHPKHIR